MTMTIQNEKQMASRARHIAKKQGMTLRKSQKPIQAFGDDLGGYRLVDTRHNSVVAGINFELTIEDVFRLLED